MELGSRALEVLVRTQVEGAGWQTNREGPASRTFSAKQSATDAWQKTTRQALNTEQADRVKNREVLQLCRSALISLADMVLASSVAGLFKWRQFEPEMILLAVGWYLRFSLSYRDVEELLAKRGLSVDHVTVWRWVQRYAPEIQRRLRPRVRLTNDSWRVDETYPG